MNCLRSVSIDSSLNQSWALGPNLDVWTIGTQNFWFGRTTAAFASFNVQGFKNINIYGVDVIGDFKSGPGGSQCIIDDWQVSLNFIGQAPGLGGEVVPLVNGLNVNTSGALARTFELSRYKTSFRLETPIQSVTSIIFDRYTASGHANQSLLNVTVNWDLNFIFYYQFEGE
jgi:hypothetical protein